MSETMIDKTNARDIVPIFSGAQICSKNHIFGPYARRYYLIHFCLSGQGEHFDKFGCHKVRA